jgi:hypothetical protein
MIDPIKKFVEQNREAFDHIEPPVDMLEQIRNRLKARASAEITAAQQQPIVSEEKKTFRLFSNKANVARWIVAASILLAVTITYLYKDDTSVKPTKELAQSHPDKGRKAHAAEAGNAMADSSAATGGRGSLIAGTADKVRNGEHSAARNAETAKTYTQKFAAGNSSYSQPQMHNQLSSRLADSTSASIRLAAILEIAGQNQISNSVLNSLSATLNNDNNSNVRLAALDVMGRYLDEEYVSSILVQSLATQNDPYVQLGLINLLSKVDDVKIENRLFALAEDPNTTEAVKNEAYGVLLSQNKL